MHALCFCLLKEVMLKKTIKYTDYNGNETEDVFYFNLSKPELVEMELSEKAGMKAVIERIIETRDNKELVELFQKIILKAYGEKSEDGKRFIKSPEIAHEFSQTAAYEALFMELATVEDAAANFMNGIVPKDMLSNNQEIPGLGVAPAEG